MFVRSALDRWRREGKGFPVSWSSLVLRRPPDPLSSVFNYGSAALDYGMTYSRYTRSNGWGYGGYGYDDFLGNPVVDVFSYVQVPPFVLLCYHHFQQTHPAVIDFGCFVGFGSVTDFGFFVVFDP